MSAEKVAVVTGSNKGIGFAIVKGLCEKFHGTIYLTARDPNRGESAVKKLKELGYNPQFHQLDVTDQDSINKFKQHLIKTNKGIDILINNAAIYFNSESTEPFWKQSEQTITVNYFGLLKVCESLFPILRNNGRVVNLSSSAGHLSRIPSLDLRKKLSEDTLTVSELSRLMNDFVENTKNNRHEANGWGNSCYVVSKVGVSALTLIQQRNFDSEDPSRSIVVNSVHPGYVATDMTGQERKGLLTVEEGAKAPLYLALEASRDIRGKYIWNDSSIVDWFAETYPGRKA